MLTRIIAVLGLLISLFGLLCVVGIVGLVIFITTTESNNIARAKSDRGQCALTTVAYPPVDDTLPLEESAWPGLQPISLGNAQQVEELARFGRGLPHDAFWIDDHFYVLTTVGLWRHAQDLEQPPELLWDYDLDIADFYISPDKRLIALVPPSPGTIDVWDLLTGEAVAQLQATHQAFDGGAFSPNGDRFAGITRTRIRIWEIASGTQIAEFALPDDVLLDQLTFSPDGSLIAVSGTERRQNPLDYIDMIQIWDVAGQVPLTTIYADSDVEFNTIAFTPEGTALASSGSYRDQALHLWDVVTGEEIRSWPTHPEFDDDLVFSPDGALISHRAQIYDAQSGDLLHDFGDYRKAVFSPEADRVATLSQRYVTGWIRVWDVASAQEIATIDAYVPSFAYATLWFDQAGLRMSEVDQDSFGSADGARTALLDDVGVSDQITFARLCDTSTRKQIAVIDNNGVVAFSSDGQALAVGTWSGIVQLWDAELGVTFTEIGDPQSGSVASIAFHPGGDLLAITHDYQEENWIELWDLGSGQRVARLAGHTGTIVSMAFSLDGKLLASSSYDGTVRVWGVVDDGE